MKIFFIELMIVSFIAFLTAKIVSHWDKSVLTIVCIILAISGVLVTRLVGYVSERLSDPAVQVKIKSEKNSKILDITCKNYALSINLLLPFDGEITEIHQYINTGDAKQTKLVNAKSKFFSNQMTSYQSTLELTLENVLPNKQLHYVMEFKPLVDILSPAYENFKMSYTWAHNGNNQYREKWISFATGKIVKEPSVQVGSFTVYR